MRRLRWRDVKIGELGRVVTGKTPPSARPELFGDVYPFITPTDVDGVSREVVTGRFVSDEGAAAFKNQMIPAGAVCFVCIGATIGKMCVAARRSLTNSTGVGTLGRVAQVLEDIENCTVDTHVSIVRPGEDCDADFFGLTLLAKQPHFEAQGVGSTGQTELSRGRIAETTLVVPPLPTQMAFGGLVRPMRRLAMTLLAKNRNLRTTRDLLLPKLVSGELDVSALPELEPLAA